MRVAGVAVAVVALLSGGGAVAWLNQRAAKEREAGREATAELLEERAAHCGAK